MMKHFGVFIIIFLLLIKIAPCKAQTRPFILVRESDKKTILERIEKQEWAKTIYTGFITQLNSDIEPYSKNPEEFIKGMPFNREMSKPGEMPPFYLTYHIENGVHKNLDNATKEEWANAGKLIQYLQIGMNCGIAYYLTNNEMYAQCASDILYSFVKAVMQSEVSDWRGRGGWLFPDDGFREVRVIGYRIPLIYDFIAPFIKSGGQPYDIFIKSKTKFPYEELQTVFRTYAGLTVNYGHTGSNHSVLEAPNLVYNALAMDDEGERKKWLSYFLTENTENQDALNVMAQVYKNKGDIWPETSQYLNGSSSILTHLMLVVNKYDPSLHLGKKYENVLFSLPALDYMVYPNDQLIRWGDGKRTGKPSFSSYEEAYLLGEMEGLENVTQEFGALLNRAFSDGIYERSGIESVFWYKDKDKFNGFMELVLPRTDQVSHAGIILQRNLSSTSDPENDLMCFVGGAHMVHGHAEGMNIELYGKGEVLGVDNGRGNYQQDIHENYSRIFAAHNTVIVNGNSRSDSGWVNLGINTVQLVTMEPMPRKDALSPYHSFSVTSFVDDKGDNAEAYQERTLALIRTSETTGYYLDVFRSKSKLPDEFHDYLYHNIGDKLEFLNEGLKVKPTPDRYMANANLPWVQNKEYRHPGWHFFEEVQTSNPYSNDVKARFYSEQFEKPIYMNLYIPGVENREYTKVLAPKTFEAPAPYQNRMTPTLVIRKNGEAWQNPFVVVYEPYNGKTNTNSIVSVEKISENGKYKGVKVVSGIQGQKFVQYIITQAANENYSDKTLEIKFSGCFAIITTDENGKLLNMYMGDGNELQKGKVSIKSKVGDAGAFLDLSSNEPIFRSNKPGLVSYTVRK